MSNLPIRYRWDGESMTPVGVRARAECDAAFVIGEMYALVEHKERSSATHNHYFACIADAWANLPDDMLEEYPTSEVLRKKALIRVGYRDERSIVCASKAEAQRVAAFVRPMDEYAIVLVSEAVVRVYSAQSQSMRAMGAKTFADSKTKTLAFIADLLGVAPDALAREGGRAA